MKNIILLFSIYFVLFSCGTEEPEKPYETKEYGVYMRGNLAGEHTSMRTENGEYHYSFNFNDRGRGPEITEIITLNDDGFIKNLEISGVNYLKDTISEVFSIQENKARWQSTSEKGETETDGRAFFSSINGTLGDYELLVRSLLDASDNAIDLLPNGQVNISSSEVHTVDGNELRLLEIVGFGFTPSYIWIDQDDRIFASVSSWLSIIDTEHFDLSEQLLEIQNQKKNTYFQTIAKGKTIIPENKVVITNTDLFDSNTASLLLNKTVIINGNTIEAIQDNDQNLPENATLIDGKGKTLLPGLFDNHVHIGREDGLMHLAAGVTSVRDMANSRELLEIKAEFDANTVIGPRVVTMAGFIDQKGPFAGPGLTISNLEEGLQAIEDYSNDGYHQIKLYSSIDPSWVKPMAEKTHELGMKLSGHIPAYMLAQDAIKDGYDEIQHINMVALNFLSDTIDTRTPKRFSEVAANSYKMNLDGEEFQSFVKLMKDNNTILDATVSIFEGMFTTKAGEPDPQFEAIIGRLPLEVQRGFYSGGLPIPEGEAENYKASFKKLLEMIKVLYDQGITVIPGTDAMAGFALHKELENYVKAGIPANEVLQMATLTSARVTSTQDQLGSVEVGKLADMVLIDGNPLEDISDIRRVEITIKNGNIYHANDLYQAIGVKHYK